MKIHHSARALAFGVVVIGLGLLTAVTTGGSRSTVAPGAASTYADHLAAVDASLASQNVSAAVRAWHEAYGAALVTGSWHPVIEVGDAMLRIGEASGGPTGAKAHAREAYMSALRRAQRTGEAAGVLRVAAAFAQLGDGAVASHCLVLAERVARANGDFATLERVRSANALRGERFVSVGTDLF